MPLVGEHDFGLHSKDSHPLLRAWRSGVAKAFTNLAAGSLAERFGRKRGAGDRLAGRRCRCRCWIGLAPDLGVHRRRQRLAWHQPGVGLVHDGDHEDRPGRPGSPRPGARPQRGGGIPRCRRRRHSRPAYSQRATHRAPSSGWARRSSPSLARVLGRCWSYATPAPTLRWSSAVTTGERRLPAHAANRVRGRPGFRDPVLRACSQAGLVNNLNDALAWGLAPLFLAAHGASVQDIAIVAAVYPGDVGRRPAGHRLVELTDTGRKPLIASGMLVQAVALTILVAGNGAFPPSLLAAFLLGVGTAMVYPTLIAAVSDACPAARPRPYRRRLPLLAGFRLRVGGPDCRDRHRPSQPHSGDHPRRGAHRGERPGCGCYDVAVTSRCSCHRNTCDPERRTPMAIEVEGLDVALLRSQIQRTYADVSTQPDREFIFPRGAPGRSISATPRICWRGYPRHRASRSPASRTRSRWDHSSPARTCSTSALAPAWTR